MGSYALGAGGFGFALRGRSDFGIGEDERCSTSGFNIPLVVRLEGTEVEQARKMLAESKLNIISATGLTDAAKKVVGSISA